MKIFKMDASRILSVLVSGTDGVFLYASYVCMCVCHVFIEVAVFLKMQERLRRVEHCAPRHPLRRARLHFHALNRIREDSEGFQGQSPTLRMRLLGGKRELHPPATNRGSGLNVMSAFYNEASLQGGPI